MYLRVGTWNCVTSNQLEDETANIDDAGPKSLELDGKEEWNQRKGAITREMTRKEKRTTGGRRTGACVDGVERATGPGGGRGIWVSHIK